MLLRNAEGRYLYLILKDIDVVLKKRYQKILTTAKNDMKLAKQYC